MKAAIRTRAARLYALAMVAHTEALCAEGEIEADVILRAAQRAQDDLERMGFDYRALGSLAQCIEAAQHPAPGYSRSAHVNISPVEDRES